MAEIKGKVERADLQDDERSAHEAGHRLLRCSKSTFRWKARIPMLLQSRAVEAKQYQQHFKGCGSREGRRLRHLQREDRQEVRSRRRQAAPADEGRPSTRPVPGSAVGPMRGKTGIQLIALLRHPQDLAAQAQLQDADARAGGARSSSTRSTTSSKKNYLKTVARQRLCRVPQQQLRPAVRWRWRPHRC